MANHWPGDVVNGYRLSADGQRWEPVDSYRPGDVVNGHRLSADGTRWEPVIAPTRVRGGAGRKVLIGVAVVLASLFLIGAVGSALERPAVELASDEPAPQEPEADRPEVATPSPTPTPTPTPSASATPSPSPEPESAEAYAAAAPVGIVVSRVVDGDTVEMADGSTVRVIGIDTPERGECGYQQASDRLAALVLGQPTVLAGGKGEDTDRYGRLLRYLDVGGTDAGEVLLREGLAVPRYNSTDGYGWHPRESRYFEVAAPPTCDNAPAQAPTQAAPPPAGGTAEPWNMPGPDLDCADIGKRVQITGTDYHRLDRDGDGWACESYG